MGEEDTWGGNCFRDDGEECDKDQTIVRNITPQMSECISLHVGQGGIRVADPMWRLFCREHEMTLNGSHTPHQTIPTLESEAMQKVFEETNLGKYRPRAVLVDVEPTATDAIRSGQCRDLFVSDQIVSGTGSTNNTFFGSFGGVNHSVLEESLDVIRQMAERCSNLEGFMLFHAIGGGTGSGLGTRLLEELLDRFEKSQNLTFCVLPSPQPQSPSFEAYNTLLALNSLLNVSHVTTIYENAAMFDIFEKDSSFYTSTMDDVNHLLAQSISAITTQIRFDGNLHPKLVDFQTNLVPFPLIPFVSTSFAPITSFDRTCQQYSTADIILSLPNPTNQLSTINHKTSKIFGATIMVRGDVVPREIGQSVVMGLRKLLTFVDWNPTGSKYGLSYRPPTRMPDSPLYAGQRCACMLTNTTGLRPIIAGIVEKFDEKFGRKEDLGRFLDDGAEDTDFVEAREFLSRLVADYCEADCFSLTGAMFDSNDGFRRLIRIYVQYNLGHTKAHKLFPKAAGWEDVLELPRERDPFGERKRRIGGIVRGVIRPLPVLFHMPPQKSQQNPEEVIIIDSDNDVEDILLDVDPVDALQTLFRDIFSNSQNLSNKALKQLRQLLSENENLFDILVTYEDIKNLSTLLTESQPQPSITNLFWILSTIACSSYNNCNSLIKSGLCLAILEKATPSTVTKQSAFLYIHIWQFLDMISEFTTLSLDSTINLLLPSIVSNTLSALQTTPQSKNKSKGATPIPKPQRSDLYRSFINFTMRETISCMVYGIETDLFEVIESKQADLFALNRAVSPSKMPKLEELVESILECITLPSISKRGVKFLEMVVDCHRHAVIVLTLFFRILSTNEGEISSFISDNGISILISLNQHSHLKTWEPALTIQTDIFHLLVKRHPLMCSDFLEHIVSSLSKLDSGYAYNINSQGQLNRRLNSFWRIVDCYPGMTKENQNVIDWWMGPTLVHLLARVSLAGDDADKAIQALTLFTNLDEIEVRTLLQHTKIKVTPPPNFPFENSPDIPESFTNLQEILTADQGQYKFFSNFQKLLPFGLYNRLSTLLEDEEGNRATIQNYHDFIVKAYRNTDTYRPYSPHTSPYATFGILLLYSLIRSERVRNLLVGSIGIKLNLAALQPIEPLYPLNALLDLLLADAPDIPSSTIILIDHMFAKPDQSGAPIKGLPAFWNEPRSGEVQFLHGKAMNNLVSKKEGRWRALTELAVTHSWNSYLQPEHCEAIMALLEEAGTDHSLFIALRVLSKHTLSEDFLLLNPTVVDRLKDVLRSHARRTDNVELVLAVFSELIRLQRRERSLEGDLVECVRGLRSTLADKRSVLFRQRGHVLWSSGEALTTTIDMVGECTQLVAHKRLSDPLQLAPILTTFLSSESTDLVSAVLDFFSTLDAVTQGSPTPFHALSQPITLLDETHNPTLHLSLADFLFKHWIISLEMQTRQSAHSKLYSSFYPTFVQVFTRAETPTQSLLLQAVLEKLDKHLKELADEVCGTQMVTQTRFFGSDGEQTEWERSVIDSAIDREELDDAITAIIPNEDSNTQRQGFDLLRFLPLFFSFYKTVHRLTVFYPDDTSTQNHYRWTHRFRSPLTSIRSAVLCEMSFARMTTDNVRIFSRFFSFICMLTEPECFPRYDPSERKLVRLLQSTHPSRKILEEELREEGFDDRREAFLHLDQPRIYSHEQDEMNIGLDISQQFPFYGVPYIAQFFPQ
ncbi:putative Tubulin alpha chain [Blattamonas nauphoetae]|uniref:Tubulin alpha chain n=1 Tax=Blattamonas nauphoetae TaxID=2049346 RepID=A0ABQ9YJ57_9EUKA|nr:putative Tubulin alpha chain [Blattamonas nauphoetae]